MSLANERAILQAQLIYSTFLHLGFCKYSYRHRTTFLNLFSAGSEFTHFNLTLDGVIQTRYCFASNRIIYHSIENHQRQNRQTLRLANEMIANIMYVQPILN